jgi:hypothetical protein
MILGIRTNPQTRREGVNISRRKKMRNGVKFLPDRVISRSCLQRVAMSTTITADTITLRQLLPRLLTLIVLLLLVVLSCIFRRHDHCGRDPILLRYFVLGRT